MNSPDFAELLGPALASAIEQRGFTTLTPVQHAVLDPSLRGRDLRISSQTGSGKTVAIGFTLREALEAGKDAVAPKNGVAAPLALVITPTRELAKQVDEELSWLYAPQSVKVASVTGGGGYRDERRAFAQGPAVIVGTPGRLLDHLRRGSIDASAIGTVVLDEADRMLDLGFREELEGILSFAPTPHTTHLVSATFPRDVRVLADKVQTEPVNVEGTPLGTANADIDHMIHLVSLSERTAAVINLLLSDPDSKTLVFARMRSEVSELTNELKSAGFHVRSLSGEMEQPERNRALDDFKRGRLHALVATDVAARGIDVQDISHVIHVEPPTDVDTYTHRSGRTGRAGRKGISSVLTPPAGFAKTSALLRRAGVTFRVEAIPTADALREQRQERLFTELTSDASGTADADWRCAALAERIVESGQAAQALTRLLSRVGITGPCEPRDVTPHAPPAERKKLSGPSKAGFGDGPARPRPTRKDHPADWVTFRVTWGGLHGANPRRLFAMMCRRGGVQGGDVGAIEIAKTHSFVNIAKAAASSFEEAARVPDPRDPRVSIHRADGDAPRPKPAAKHHPAAKPHAPAKHHPATHAKPHSGGVKRKSHAEPKPRADRPSKRQVAR
ncbi:DEAD/DEAH box helicase [Pendulispora rubella]|uniref:DEAD/DEAH box helicase n=1 Tax=Pendulispora rubella TaxID=2741070 RepID=A0ABZ2L6M5_9BACT